MSKISWKDLIFVNFFLYPDLCKPTLSYPQVDIVINNKWSIINIVLLGTLNSLVMVVFFLLIKYLNSLQTFTNYYNVPRISNNEYEVQ